MNKETNFGTESNFQSTVAALYDGGWRSQDAEWLQEEYGFSASMAEDICEALSELEAQ